MYLKSISVSCVRNYRRLDLELEPGLNLFYGDNAQGKTNLLEAGCFLGSLRSFRGVKAAALVSWGEPGGVIRGEAVSQPGASGRPGTGRPGRPEADGARAAGTVSEGRAGLDRALVRKLQVGIADGKRRVALDGKSPASAREYLLALKVASFSPEDIFLVKEYPSHRRRFIDRSVFHLSPGFLDLANGYRGGLRQLNAALRAKEPRVVEAWEELLAPMAAKIVARRREQADLVRRKAAPLFERLLGDGELDLTYKSSVKGDDEDALAASCRELFKKKRQEALKRGYCTAGPHTDDLKITVSGREIKEGASRGQSRLALLALALADAALYRERRGEDPVLMLDDVVSELDTKRKTALIGLLSEAGQALLTSTDPAPVREMGGALFKVASESVVRQ